MTQFTDTDDKTSKLEEYPDQGDIETSENSLRAQHETTITPGKYNGDTSHSKTVCGDGPSSQFHNEPLSGRQVQYKNSPTIYTNPNSGLLHTIPTAKG